MKFYWEKFNWEIVRLHRSNSKISQFQNFKIIIIMKQQKKSSVSRRKFLGESLKATIGSAIAVNFPTIVPASVFGKFAPSNLINVASIGCGRISTIHDMTSIARYAGARIISVCDLDKNRANAGPLAVKNNYIRA